MPISEKILNEIKTLNEKPDIKKLMNSVLSYEDEGAKKYKQEFLKMVDDYLKVDEEESSDGRDID